MLAILNALRVKQMDWYEPFGENRENETILKG